MSKKSSKSTTSVILSNKYNRNFSEEFKKSKVMELAKGDISIASFCRIYEVSRSAVYKWIYLYSGTPKGHRTVLQMDSEQHKTLQLAARVAELERIIGQKQLEIDYLNKAIEIEGEALGYDIKKKYEPMFLNGSGKKGKNTDTK